MSDSAPQPRGARRDDGARITGPCPNCGDPTDGNYCPNCGQKRVHRRVSLRRMLAEVLEDQFALDSTLPRTLGSLLFKPGHLSSEYVGGRINRYVPPFRLYLASSVLFFLLLTFFMRDVRISTRDGDVAMARDSVRAALAGLDSTERAAVARAGGGRFLRELQDSIAAAGAAADSLAANARVTGGIRPAGDGPTAGRAGAADSVASPYLWGEELRITTSWSVLDTLLAHRLDALRRLPADVAIDEVRGQALQRLPTAVFLMLPVFALLLKVLYIRRGRFYVEHFVFGLHTHAFTFLMFTLMLLGRTTWIRLPATLWMMLYFLVALRRFYGQGWFKTLLKYIVLFNAYAIVIGVGIVGLVVAALLLG